MTLLLAALAVGRLTRLVVDDRFPFAPVRRWVQDHWDDGYELITCPWCFSGWASLAVIVGLEVRGSVPLSLLAWGAVWAGAVVTYFLCEVLAKYATPE